MILFLNFDCILQILSLLSSYSNNNENKFFLLWSSFSPYFTVVGGEDC